MFHGICNNKKTSTTTTNNYNFISAHASTPLKSFHTPLQVKNIKHAGSLTKAQIVAVAKQMHYKSQSREFAGTVKQILGTAVSLGCKVEGEHPGKIQEQIDEGEWEIPEM